ncbi:SDR family oxidoreductase [Paenibacillus sp. TRM 82003]|nr:SDR family oxidoreductase [Paenibacillus sp. TRM 82003]
MKLAGKVAWVTEADSPSGQALLRRFAREGASLLLHSASGGDSIAAELAALRASGVAFRVVTAELTKSSDVERMLATVATDLGEVDVLLHNQNRVFPIDVETGDEARFLDIMNANAKTAFVCAKTVGKRMSARQRGRIVFVGSIHAEKPTGASFAYSASKSAVKMLAREAAVVLGRSGITVNTIEFGPVEGDDETFRSDVSRLYDGYRCKVPNAELGTHDDLAELAAFLALDEAWYLNGADIRMDGGFLLHYMDVKSKKPEGTP